MERIPASERTREKLRALMAGRSEVEDERSELVRLAARLIIEEALEGETRDALGRDYYARGARPGAGYRNGYRRGRVPSAEGAIEYSAPQIANREEPFRSRIREVVRGRTEELEALAVEMYARGLSTRDIEAVFADANGRSLLSRTAVRSPSGCGRSTRRLPAVICLNSRSPTCLSMALPSGCIWASRARPCWRPGAFCRTAKRRCCTWRRGPRRIPRAAASSSTTCAGAVCPTRCWWPATERPA